MRGRCSHTSKSRTDKYGQPNVRATRSRPPICSTLPSAIRRRGGESGRCREGARLRAGGKPKPPQRTSTSTSLLMPSVHREARLCRAGLSFSADGDTAAGWRGRASATCYSIGIEGSMSVRTPPWTMKYVTSVPMTVFNPFGHLSETLSVGRRMLPPFGVIGALRSCR
jgi:hypothetical protein